MRPDDYRRWLEQEDLRESTIRTYLYQAKKLETHYGDLDDRYDVDELRSVLAELEYTKADEQRNRPNPSKIPMNDSALHSNLKDYRSTVSSFIRFRKAEESKRPSDRQWDKYLGEADKLIEDGSLDEEGYKEPIANAMAAVRTALLAGDENWSNLLTEAVRDGGNNLIAWRDKGKIVDWIEEDPATVEDALAEMWSEGGEKSLVDRVSSFDSKLPERVFTEGRRTARLDLASYLMMAMQEERLPPIKLTVFERTYTRLGYPASDGEEDVGGRYGHAIAFLDRVIAEAGRRGMGRPATRLDAQSVVWSLQAARWDTDDEDDELPGPSTRRRDSGDALNTILYGPPGTGKTYRTVERCVTICDGEAPRNREEVRRRYEELAGEGRVEFVTFHQSYGYEEFVEGIRPVEKDGQVVYRVEPGILRRLANEARNAWKPAAPAGGEWPNFVLVIDEINRANVSKVMGELITLLEEDKREGAENEVTVTLPYSREPFTLPDNLHILGTMNTADRSIALLDTALRRRFDFEEMAPDPGLLEDARERTGVDLPRVLATMNERLEYLVDRDHLIGHAWLMRANDRPGLDEIMRRKVIPLIAEYFYDDWQKVRAVLGDTDHFIERVALDAPPGMDPDMLEGRYRWSVRREFSAGAYEGLLGGSGGDAGNG